jgi:hypothetical protein
MFMTAHGQSPNRVAKPENYEVVFADYMDVDFADRAGYRIRIVGIYIRPNLVSKQFLSQVVSKLRTKYSSDNQLTILFSADKTILSGFLDNTETKEGGSRFLNAMRGIYVRRINPDRNELRYFPTGMREKDIEN